jgi:hypothetical protein
MADYPQAHALSIRPLSERELNDYLAACVDVTDEELLDIKAADGVSLRDILTDANAIGLK